MVFENIMVPKVSEYFKNMGYQTFTEVPIMRKKVDLVAFDNKNSIAVELKVKDWHRALRQAAIYKVLADYAYVAIWHEYLHRVNIEQFKQLGVGIIEVNMSAIINLKAEKSKIKEKRIEEELIRATVGKNHD
jgi:hypothetical protein